MDCLFCKIANGEIPSNKVYEDEKVYAFFQLFFQRLVDLCPDRFVLRGHALPVIAGHKNGLLHRRSQLALFAFFSQFGKESVLVS